MLKECEPGIYRTSLRSKGEVNVAKVAEKFWRRRTSQRRRLHPARHLGRSRGKDHCTATGCGETGERRGGCD